MLPTPELVLMRHESPYLVPAADTAGSPRSYTPLAAIRASPGPLARIVPDKLDSWQLIRKPGANHPLSHGILVAEGTCLSVYLSFVPIQGRAWCWLSPSDGYDNAQGVGWKYPWVHRHESLIPQVFWHATTWVLVSGTPALQTSSEAPSSVRLLLLCPCT